MPTLSQILCAIVLILLTSCNQAPPASSNSDNAAIRQQLAELHEDMKTLKGEVTLMKDEVTQLRQSPPFKTPSSPVEARGAAQLPESRFAELHREIKTLNVEVMQLRQAVTEMHRVVLLNAAAPAPETPPQPPPVAAEVSLDDDPVMGDRAAKVGVIEFSDYQCPFCNRFHTQTFPKLKETYIDTGKVQYIFRDFPLEFHPEAKGAAIAANCAGEQGAYWEMYDRLFRNQRRLGSDLYIELAQQLKLNIPTFLNCLKKPNWGKEVDNDLAYGQSAGVSGTPSFFIGRIQGERLVDAQLIVGAQPFSVFAQAIDALLEDGEPAELDKSQVAKQQAEPPQPQSTAPETGERGDPGRAPKAPMADLSSLDQFKQLFLDGGGRVRLIALLSPN
jgi:protein-disulfide isomerase